MQHRKEHRQEESVNFRLESALRARLDATVARLQAAAPIGTRVTLGMLCRDLIVKALDELEAGK